MFRKLLKLLAPVDDAPELGGGAPPDLPQPQDPSELEADDANDEPQQDAPSRQETPRQQRRRARFEEFQNAARERDDYRRRNDELQRQIDELRDVERRALQPAPQATPQQSHPAPGIQISPEVQTIISAQDALQREYSALPEEQQRVQYENYNRRFRELDVARQQRIAAEVAAGFQATQPAQQVDQDAVRREIIRMRYSDVLNYRDPATRRTGAQMLAAAVQYKVNIEGASDDDPEVIEEAANELRERFNIGSRNRETQTREMTNDRNRFSGSRSAAPQTAGSRPAAKGKALQWTSGMKTVAIAWADGHPKYANASEAEKLQAWANQVGRKYVTKYGG